MGSRLVCCLYRSNPVLSQKGNVYNSEWFYCLLADIFVVPVKPLDVAVEALIFKAGIYCAKANMNRHRQVWKTVTF